MKLDSASVKDTRASPLQTGASFLVGTFGVYACRRLRPHPKGSGYRRFAIRCLRAGLKRRSTTPVADNSIVQRSTLITGVLLATSGAMLGGVGYWVSGGFDYLSASATYDVPGIGDYDHSNRMPAGLSGTATTPKRTRFGDQRCLHLSQERSRGSFAIHRGG